MQFSLEANPMGSEVYWPDRNKPREFSISVYGTDDLQSIQIVKNNIDVQDYRLKDNFLELAWVDTEQAGDSDYYYLRITQQDGHGAWTSPIWVDCTQ